MESKLSVMMLSLLLTSCGTSAYTAETSYYGKINLGWAYVKDNKIIISNDYGSATLKANGSGNFTTGALGIGHSYGNDFRTDLELYVDDGVKGRKPFNKTLINFKVKTYASFFNAYYDFRNTTNFTPFIMGGVGYAFNKVEISSCSKIYKKNSNDVAWQLGIGTSYEVNPNLALEASYRYINKGIRDSTLSESGSATINTYKSAGHIHALLIGTKITF
jgi:opacity protein-like surface antigen